MFKKKIESFNPVLSECCLEVRGVKLLSVCSLKPLYIHSILWKWKYEVVTMEIIGGSTHFGSCFVLRCGGERPFYATFLMVLLEGWN